jgi:hypothetical protein
MRLLMAFIISPCLSVVVGLDANCAIDIRRARTMPGVAETTA